MPPYALGLYDLLSTLDQDTRQFLVDNDDIDVASTHLVEEPAEGRAVHVAAREATVIELVDDVKAGIAAAHEALAIGDDDPLVRAMCAWALFRLADDLTAVDAARRAVAENPNSLLVLLHASCVFGLVGEADEAFRCCERAYHLSPGAPEA
jgi:hypothetical protein